jgi:hypothetical protein
VWAYDGVITPISDAGGTWAAPGGFEQAMFQFGSGIEMSTGRSDDRGVTMPGIGDGLAFAKGVEPAFKAVARTNLELMTLASKRAQAMVSLPTRMAACRTPHDVFNEQVRFWQGAFAQYAESTRNIASAWSMFNPAAQIVASQMDAWQRQHGVGRQEAAKSAYELITFPEPKATRDEPSRSPARGERQQGAGRTAERVAASAA